MSHTTSAVLLRHLLATDSDSGYKNISSLDPLTPLKTNPKAVKVTLVEWEKLPEMIQSSDLEMSSMVKVNQIPSPKNPCPKIRTNL